MSVLSFKDSPYNEDPVTKLKRDKGSYNVQIRNWVLKGFPKAANKWEKILDLSQRWYVNTKVGWQERKEFPAQAIFCAID